ncbi:MAG: J domain-containing protein [Acidimicrobiales bacterium]
MADVATRTHYELFGVDPDCTFEELRRAYRRLARENHPDVTRGGTGRSMAEVNEAWRVLSDVGRRRHYDESVKTPLGDREPVATPQPAPQTTPSRRRAWAASVQGQIARISRLAGRSATQALLIRHPRAPRFVYEEIVEDLVIGLCEDTESRVRAARAAGAAPLDLAVAATLVGIRTLADRIRRNASLGLDDRTVMAAELLDRMWDILAHELTVQLTGALGGNPHVARQLGDVPRFQRPPPG